MRRPTISSTPDEPRNIDPNRAVMDRFRKLLNGEAHMVDDVDLGSRMMLEGFRPARSGEEIERKQESRDTAGSLDVEKRPLHEPLMQPVPVRRVRDDIAGNGSRVSKEINAGKSDIVAAKIARNDGVSGAAKFRDDGSLTTGGFPDIAFELDVSEKGACRRRMGRVVVEPRTVVSVRTNRSFPGGRGEDGRIHKTGGEEIRAFASRPKASRSSKEEPNGANP